MGTPPVKISSSASSEETVRQAAGSRGGDAAAHARPAGSEAAAKPKKKTKQRQAKVVRDSFTMPETDYAIIGELKQAWLAAGIEVKKSQLLRAGLHALARLPKTAQKKILADLEPVKTGRPARKRSAA